MLKTGIFFWKSGRIKRRLKPSKRRVWHYMKTFIPRKHWRTRVRCVFSKTDRKWIRSAWWKANCRHRQMRSRSTVCMRTTTVWRSGIRSRVRTENTAGRSPAMWPCRITVACFPIITIRCLMLSSLVSVSWHRKVIRHWKRKSKITAIPGNTRKNLRMNCRKKRWQKIWWISLRLRQN